ncbi:MAG TPA: AAA family ATPase [Dehalococcoidia bacterium]|nr:AAA family ATPase [Dehalococcoidia bacterium]
MIVVSIVGMAGAGKSEVAGVFEENGFTRIRFGDITDQEIEKRGLEPGEESERYVRELLRREQGMAAYARLNRPHIDSALKDSDVVVDGLYSWEEYTLLKDCYGDGLSVVAVWASPRTRYARLVARASRRLTDSEAANRDRAEIENVNKGGPIAMADYTIINESSIEKLRAATERIIARLDGKEGKKTKETQET